jgi:hypothetical protein
MTPTKIFKKSSAAYDMAKVALLLFWLPLIVMIVMAYLHS